MMYALCNSECGDCSGYQVLFVSHNKELLEEKKAWYDTRVDETREAHEKISEKHREVHRRNCNNVADWLEANRHAMINQIPDFQDILIKKMRENGPTYSMISNTHFLGKDVLGEIIDESKANSPAPVLEVCNEKLTDGYYLRFSSLSIEELKEI
jgi:hypothetical protein